MLKSVEQPELTYRTNVLGTHRLLEGARAAGVTALAFASTERCGHGPDGGTGDHRARRSCAR